MPSMVLEQRAAIEADALVIDVDDAARVDHVVGRVEDATLHQLDAVAGFGELVVWRRRQRPSPSAAGGCCR